MWIILDGFDMTDVVDYRSIRPTQSLNDPQPNAELEVDDIGSLLAFSVGMECIIFDENPPPTYTYSGRAVPTIPAHNLVRLSDQTSQWSSTGMLSALIPPAGFPTMTFSNNAVGSGFLQATTYNGYIHVGQQYMFSIYEQISGTGNALTNANAVVKMEFLSSSGTVLSTVQDARNTTNATQQRIAISGVAPSGCVNIRVSFGGTTTSTTNSGSIAYGSAQLEPMWFASRGVSYPTPDCNIAQVSCALMPDGTTSRACRVFAGYIDNITIDRFDGNDRTWILSLAGPGALLEDGMINASFTAQYDDQILSSLISAYFNGKISLVAPNTSSALPVQRGIYVDAIAYSDNSLREVLNGLTDQSGFIYYVDWYYTLRYNPSFYTAANFMLTDAEADNVETYNYSGYRFESDGTQLKRRIKVTGGKGLATAFQQFNGNGSNKTFTLTYIPAQISSLTVGSTNQRVGIKGRDSYSNNDVLLDKTAKQLIFNTAPASGTNNVSATYSYEANMATQAVDNSQSFPVIPAYAQPSYDAKVNDTSLNSLTAASQRGIAELIKYNQPKTIIQLKANQYAQVGSLIYITHQASGIINQPFIVQKVAGRYLGNGLNEFSYQLGSYQPSIIDHLRNANKAMNRTTSITNANDTQQYSFTAFETIGYRDDVVAAIAASYSTGVYGTAKYGQAAYGGATGTYGGTAQYGRSTIYG